MKKIVAGILFGSVLLIILNGCMKDEDGYSLNQMWVGFGIIEQMNSEPPEYRISMDNGDVLTPVASTYANWYYYYGINDTLSKLKTGDRILINYTVIGDDGNEQGNVSEYYIRVNSVQKILFKNIIDITPENQDSIGDDPIIVRDWWITDSLINFEIKYLGNDAIHFINLVKQPGTLTSEGQPIELELRHNSNGDSQDIPYAGYVSFKLNALQIEGLDSVEFRVTSTDYNNEISEFEGVYSYN